LEPVAVQSGVAEAGRAVAMSRTSVSGSSSVDLGSGTVANSRQSSLQRRRTCRAVTRARTPPLQTRERNRQKLESAQQETSTTNVLRNLPTPCRSRTDRATAPQTPRVASSRNLQHVALESSLLEKLAKQCEKAPVAIDDSMVARPRSVDCTDASLDLESPTNSLVAMLAEVGNASPAAASASPPQMFLGSSRGGSPSTVPQVLSEADTSPLDLPSSGSGVREPRLSSELGASAAPQETAVGMQQDLDSSNSTGGRCVLPRVASGPPAPRSWGVRGVLMERDTNTNSSPTRGRLGCPASEKCRFATASPGLAPNEAPKGSPRNNAFVATSPSLRYGNENSPPSAISSGTSISFNMSPLAKNDCQHMPLSARADHRVNEQLNGMFVDRGSLSLSSNSRQSMLMFSALSRREESPLALEEATGIVTPAASECITVAHTPVSEAKIVHEAADDWVRVNEKATDDLARISAGKAASAQQLCDQAPLPADDALNEWEGETDADAPVKVSQMCDLWEQRLSRPSLGDTMQSSKASLHSPKRSGSVPSLKEDMRSSSWVTSASKMARRLQRQERRTTKTLDELMRRIREISDVVDIGSPCSSTTSDPESPYGGCSSPMTQLHGQIFTSLSSQMSRQIRAQQRLSRAVLQVVSLENGSLRREQLNTEPQPRAGAFDLPQDFQPCPAVVTATPSQTPICSPSHSVVLDDGLHGTERTRLSISPLTDAQLCRHHCLSEPISDCKRVKRLSASQQLDGLRGSSSTVPQPEEEAEAGSLSCVSTTVREQTTADGDVDFSGNSQSTGCMDDSEPARESQHKESPEERRWLPPVFAVGYDAASDLLPALDAAAAPQESPEPDGEPSEARTPAMERRLRRSVGNGSRHGHLSPLSAAESGTPVESPSPQPCPGAATLAFGGRQRHRAEANTVDCGFLRAEEGLEEAGRLDEGIEEEEELNAEEREGEGEDVNSSMETTEGTEIAEIGAESQFEDANLPRPGDEGMPRCKTFLHQFELNELQKQVLLVVPEGIAENRMVSFMFENKKHDVQIPEGFSVGQEVPILVPKRPPLERNQAQAWCRGHQNWTDRLTLTEPLKHSSRLGGNCTLNDPEFKHRWHLYCCLRGTSMNPLLPFTPEEPEEECEQAA